MRVSLVLVTLVGIALTPPQSARATPGEVLVPRSDSVRLYEEPRSTAQVLQVLNRSHRLLEFRREGSWVNVGVFRMVARRGWIRGGDVVAERAILDPPPVKPAQRDSADDERATPQFVLDISGTPAIKFRTSCHVITRDEEEQEFRFAGLVPDRAIAEARAVSCIVRKVDAAGRLKVTLLAGETPVAAVQTRAAFNWLRVRSDGPWGSAGAVRGSVGLVVPKMVDPSRRGGMAFPPLGQPAPKLQMR